MQQGLTIAVVDPDEDYLGIEIRVANGRFSGSTRIFAGLTELGEFATVIAGFPAASGDDRGFEFGTPDPGFAGGHCRVRLLCVDGAGHSRIEVAIDDDRHRHEPATASFSFPVLAADIDRFTHQLRELEKAQQGIAHLQQAV